MDQRPKTTKLSEDDTEQKLRNTEFVNDFLDMTSKGQSTKGETDKLNFMTNYKFCTLRDTIHRVKKQLTEWEKIFVNNVSDMGLISRIYKEPLKPNKQTYFKNGQRT